MKKLKTEMKAYERTYIWRVLNTKNWNIKKTAKTLCIGVSSLYRKMKELKIG